MERRASLELRAKGRRLEGYAAVFGTDTRAGVCRSLGAVPNNR
jgi:hypothetical protein